MHTKSQTTTIRIHKTLNFLNDSDFFLTAILAGRIKRMNLFLSSKSKKEDTDILRAITGYDWLTDCGFENIKEEFYWLDSSLVGHLNYTREKFLQAVKANIDSRSSFDK